MLSNKLLAPKGTVYVAYEPRRPAIIVLLSVGNADIDGTDDHAFGKKAEDFIIAHPTKDIYMSNPIKEQ
ncbi:MAG: hypothetical protein GXP63_03455 [DPANN group archaeon]|nr:hypothetical protein [DPANN group archaeon]